MKTEDMSEAVKESASPQEGYRFRFIYPYMKYVEPAVGCVDVLTLLNNLYDPEVLEVIVEQTILFVQPDDEYGLGGTLSGNKRCDK